MARPETKMFYKKIDLQLKMTLINNNNNNNNNNISLLQTHGPYTYKKMLNIYKNSNNNNIISQRKIVLINITLISIIAEWESEYKQ